MEFLRQAVAEYRMAVTREMGDHHSRQQTGLRLGIDCGSVGGQRMMNRREYVGLPINVACRLQGRAEVDGIASSMEAHERYFEDVIGFAWRSEEGDLKGVGHRQYMVCRLGP